MKQSLRRLLILLAVVPAGHLLPGCKFDPQPLHPPFDPGAAPLTSAIFCDVEADRRCSTADDRMVGIDGSKPFEDGFWVGLTSKIALDYSPQALSECSGQPKAIIFQTKFPDGDAACVSPGAFPALPDAIDRACKDWCFDQGWIDREGNRFGCDDIAWHSNGATAPFAGACAADGKPRPDFQDPRRMRMNVPVTWTAVSGATVNGSDLAKTAATGWGDAGAVSTHQLTAANGQLITGDGAVSIMASETTTKRAFGLGNGTTNVSFDQIEFGLVLDVDANLLVCEAGACGTAFAGQYTPGDILEVNLSGGQVTYKKNGVILKASTGSPVYPLRAAAALFTTGATLNAAHVSF